MLGSAARRGHDRTQSRSRADQARRPRRSDQATRADGLPLLSSSWPRPGWVLRLLLEHLRVALTIRVKAGLLSAAPGLSEFRACDVPILPALAQDGAQIEPDLLDRGPTEEPVAAIHLEDDEPRFRHDRVRNHRVMHWISVLGNVEILLHLAPGIRQEWPVRAHTGTKLVRVQQVVRADGDEAAVANLHLSMKLQQALVLATVLRAEAASAEDHDHGVHALQLRELAVLARVVREFVVRKHCAGNDVCPHGVPLLLLVRRGEG